MRAFCSVAVKILSRMRIQVTMSSRRTCMFPTYDFILRRCLAVKGDDSPEGDKFLYWLFLVLPVDP